MYHKFQASIILFLSFAAIVLIHSHSLASAEAITTTNVHRAANFTVHYRGPGNQGTCDTSEDGALVAWPNEAKLAMNHVVDTLDDLITSSQTIVVDACYQPHNEPTSLAYASAADQYDADYGLGTLSYAVALVNARDNTDNNGDRPEITTSANSAIAWDFCTTNCTVDAAKFDFVSTLIHEFLHGLGFSMGFGVDSNQSPTTGNFPSPAGVTDYYVYTSAAYVANPNKQLITLANNSADLLNIFQAGSGMVEFRGPNTVAINGFAPYIYSVSNQWEAGSSMSHLDDNHPTNLGRMMNAATPEGPSARTIDAITLMFLKDIGWTVNEASDYGDSTLSAYGSARHINSKTLVNALWLGADITAEASEVSEDSADDGVQQSAPWTNGSSGGKLGITVASSASTARGCVSAWIDWDSNNNFTDSSDAVISMQPVTNGSQTINFTVPNSTFGSAGGANKTFNVRVRLQPDWDLDGSCSDQVAMRYRYGIAGGEVEDYQFTFSSDGTTLSLNNKSYIPITTRN